MERTGFWLSVWKKWCIEKKITDEIENYEPTELNTLFEHFYAKVKNKQGEDYEPESLKVMIALLDRHFKVTRPSFFGGVPSYFEAFWYPHLYFYCKCNTSNG